MSTHRPLILFETNEIPFRTFDDYVERHPACALASVMAGSRQIVTICEDQIELDPWNSWPTLERVVIDEDHQILHLGQSLEAASKSYPPVWELPSRAGILVRVMGSLHSSTKPDDLSRYDFYLPDFFANNVFAHPPALTKFQRLNLTMTRASARNVRSKVPIREALSFLAYYLPHGMRASTAKWVAASMASEVRNKHLKCRHRSVLPLLTLDLFLHQMRKSNPDFSTLFTNHVASALCSRD